MAVRTEHNDYDTPRSKKTKAVTGAVYRAEGRIRTKNPVIMVEHGIKTKQRKHPVVSSGSLANSAGFRDLVQRQNLRVVKENKKIKVNGKSAVSLVGKTAVSQALGATEIMLGSIEEGEAAAEIDNGESSTSAVSSAGKALLLPKIQRESIIQFKNLSRYEKKYTKKEKKLDDSLKNYEKAENKYEKTVKRAEALRSVGDEKSVRRVNQKLSRQKKRLELQQGKVDAAQAARDKAKKKLEKKARKKIEEKITQKVIAWIFGILGSLTVIFLGIFVLVALLVILLAAASDDSNSSSGDAGALEGNEAIIYNYFSGLGYGDVQCAAILGNFKGELSSFDPTYDTGNVLGIMQWTGSSRTALVSWANTNGLNVYDLNTQLRYASEVYIPGHWYFPTYTGIRAYPEKYNVGFEEWKNLTDVDIATGAFCAMTEQPYYYNSNIDSLRIPYAREYLQKIQSSSSYGTSQSGLQVIDYAKSWVGHISYKLGASGDLKVNGKSDSSWFIYHCLKDCGIDLDKHYSPKEWGTGKVPDTTKIDDIDDAQEGDILYWKKTDKVVFYAGSKMAVGCYDTKGTSIASVRYANYKSAGNGKEPDAIYRINALDSLTNLDWVNWAISIANDDSHGYSQANRTGNPDYDCSSLVAAALQQGGYNVSMDMYTGDEIEILTGLGFKLMPFSLSTAQTGDILWRSGHTEIFIGNGQTVGAHCSETGGKTGVAGDQTGKEIDVRACGNFTYILRPPNISSSSSKSSSSSSSTTAKQSDYGTSLGTFKLTAYCNCSICNGKWAGGPTASGAMPTQGKTVATAGFDFGTRLIINGQIYTVEDRGTPYGHIDIFFSDHTEASNFGVQYATVYLAK